MAARYFSVSSVPMITPIHVPTRATRSVVMSSKNHVSLPTRSSHLNKVFEDRSAGIVCYRDENGEITCEGYDEGPRFHRKLSRFGNNASMDVEVIELLQRCWLQVTDEN